MTVEDRLRAVVVGALEPLAGKIELADSDPAWPARYAVHAARIRAALGDRVRQLEHAGSTSVPGLCAKPIIDILLAVADSADEPAYVPDLEAAGYVLRIREPAWHEHRCFHGADPIRLHVFSHGSPEIARMLAFRDHLRRDAADRERYAAVKRELATRDWRYMDEYAEAKSAVVADIQSRAQLL